MSENIILTGFMGSGKDSVAKEISKKTDLAFISMDDYIVLKEKRTINDIFEESGEEYFRKAET
jgi:shikimate kinase